MISLLSNFLDSFLWYFHAVFLMCCYARVSVLRMFNSHENMNWKSHESNVNFPVACLAEAVAAWGHVCVIRGRGRRLQTARPGGWAGAVPIPGPAPGRAGLRLREQSRGCRPLAPAQRTLEQRAWPRPASEKEPGCAPSWVPCAPASGRVLCVHRGDISGFDFVGSVQVIGCCKDARRCGKEV